MNETNSASFQDGSASTTASTTKIFPILLVIAALITVIATTAIVSYSLGKNSVQPNINQPEIVQPYEQNNGLLSQIHEVRVMSSINKTSKLVILNEKDENGFGSFEAYLVDDVSEVSSENHLFSIGNALYSHFQYIPDTQPGYFYLLVHQGDHQKLVIANDDGEVITTDGIVENAEAIGLGTVILGQYGVDASSIRYLFPKTLQMNINSATGEIFQIEIDLQTGKYVEGSREKIN